MQRCKMPNSRAAENARNELEGVVVSDKAKKTAVIERSYTIYLHKYERSLRRTSRIAAYSPECIGAKTGDTVTIAGTRRLSKMKSFVVTQIVKKASQ